MRGWPKRLLLLLTATLTLALCPGNAHACPAYPGVVEVTDAGGSTHAVVQHGDEFFSCLTDTDGNLLCDMDGYLYYVVYEGDAFAKGDRLGGSGKKRSSWNLFGGDSESVTPDARTRVTLSDGATGLVDKLTALNRTLAAKEAQSAVTPFSLLLGAGYDHDPITDAYTYNSTGNPLAGKWADMGNVAAPTKADTCPLLVLKVQFSDVKCLFTDTQWHDRIFGGVGSGNSVSDYYTKVSNQQFTYVPANETYHDNGGMDNDGVITVTLPIDRPAFVDSYTGQTYDRGAETGVYTATDGTKYTIYNNSSFFAYGLAAADDYIDFRAYDRNGDGYISPTELAVVVVAAGYEASYCTDFFDEYNKVKGKHPLTWASSWHANTYYLDGDNGVGDPGAVVLDGKRLYKFTILGENLQAKYDYTREPTDQAQAAPIQAAIGTLCHELGHDLGLQDLYAPLGSGEQTAEVLSLSLMADGSWGFTFDEWESSARNPLPGSTPSFLDAFSKMLLGFTDAVTVTEPGVYQVTEAATPDKYNILRVNTNDPDVYYLIENRTFHGYDGGIFYSLGGPGGVVYWRINERVVRANYRRNTVNATPGSYGIMPAYITYDYSCVDASQPFRCDYTAPMQPMFPVEKSVKQLFSFDHYTAPTANVWVGPFALAVQPANAFPQGCAPGDIDVTLDVGGYAGVSDLTGIAMDGAPLTAPNQYRAKSGSVVVELRETYLNTLAPGAHTLRLTVHGYPYAETTITVTAPATDVPNTGDNSLPLLWAGALLLAAGAFVYRLRRRQSRGL